MESLEIIVPDPEAVQEEQTPQIVDQQLAENQRNYYDAVDPEIE